MYHVEGSVGNTNGGIGRRGGIRRRAGRGRKPTFGGFVASAFSSASHLAVQDGSRMTLAGAPVSKGEL
jgi:hypothetical protein